MRNTKKTRVSNELNAFWWITLGASLTTLYFNSKIQDPFNAPKMWIVIATSAWLAGYLIVNKGWFFLSRQRKTLFYIVLSFITFYFIATIFTDNRYTAIFGENQRRNGFLTYSALVIILMTSAIYINIGNLKKLYFIGFVTGFVMTFYGLLQTQGLDFVKWNNPYNSVISTVGNPNFAAALMAVFGTLTFTIFLNQDSHSVFRIGSLISTFVTGYTIYKSGARQGLIAVSIGITFVTLIWIYQKNKKIGISLFGASILVGSGTVLGMLQMGPLADLIYKGSVTVRGYYWSAGIEMLKSNLLLGVGIDRYGAYFKEYRDVEYPLRYGFEITSSNAHNVPIQMFATGGIFLGISYLALMLLVLWHAVKLIKNSDKRNRVLASGIVAAWLAFQSQSLISIDNIGISVWGWLLSGTIIGLSINSNQDILNSQSNIRKSSLSKLNLVQPVISGTLLLIAILLISALYRGESSMFETRGKFNPSDSSLRNTLYESANKTIGLPLIEPAYKIDSAAYLVANGFTQEGLAVLVKLHELDSRNLDTLRLLADFSYQLGKTEVAISYREKISLLDPWNAKNYLNLGRNYKSVGDLAKMSQMRVKILSFAPDTEEAKQANLELN